MLKYFLETMLNIITKSKQQYIAEINVAIRIHRQKFCIVKIFIECRFMIKEKYEIK